MLDEKRINTMRRRLGSASTLVDNDQFLPRARRVQMECTAQEFAKICEISRQAKTPSHYFAKLISKANMSRTLDYVRKLIRGVIKRFQRAITKAKRTAPNVTKQSVKSEPRRNYDVPVNLPKQSSWTASDEFLDGIRAKCGFLKG